MGYQGWIKGWVSWAATWGANLLGALRCHWNNWQFGASKLRNPHAKEFFQKFSAFWACSCPRLKNCKEYCFEGGAKLLACPGHPHVLGWPSVSQTSNRLVEIDVDANTYIV